MASSPYASYAWKQIAQRLVAQAKVIDAPCEICQRPIDYTLTGRHKLGPSVDHVESLGLGGELLPGADGLRVVHSACNSRRGGRLSSAMRGKVIKGRFFQVPPGIPPTVVSCLPAGVGEGSAGAPRLFSERHPEAVGSFGPAWAAWAESTLTLYGKPLRLHTWQRMVLDRLLEHDRHGGLCWREAVISTPRQVGKSTLSAVYSLARCAHAAELGGLQGVLLVSAGLRQATRLHEAWWPWAVDHGLGLRRLMDAAQITFFDGSWWRLSSAKAVWGSTCDAAVVDESWDVPAPVAEGALQPTLVSRPSSQLILSSTANTDATELTPTWRQRATGGSVRTMIAEWSAGPNDDADDPEVWRRASPLWTRERAELVAAQRTAAGWTENWLNRWPVAESGPREWPAGWSACRRVTGPPPAGAVAAIEVSQDMAAFGVAVGVVDRHGVQLWTARTTTLPDALATLTRWLPAVVLCGASLADRCLGRWVVHPAGQAETRQATPMLADLVARGQLAHDHGAAAAEESRRARVINVESGPVLSARASKGSVAVLKAAVWTAWAVSTGSVRPVRPQIW